VDSLADKGRTFEDGVEITYRYTFNELARRFEGVRAKIPQILERIGQAGVARAKEVVPSGKTGGFHKSLRYVVEGDNVFLTSDAPYARVLHGGSRQTPGRFVPKIGKRLKKPTITKWVKLAPGKKGRKGYPAVKKRMEVPREDFGTHQVKKKYEWMGKAKQAMMKRAREEILNLIESVFRK